MCAPDRWPPYFEGNAHPSRLHVQAVSTSDASQSGRGTARIRSPLPRTSKERPARSSTRSSRCTCAISLARSPADAARDRMRRSRLDAVARALSKTWAGTGRGARAIVALGEGRETGLRPDGGCAMRRIPGLRRNRRAGFQLPTLAGRTTARALRA